MLETDFNSSKAVTMKRTSVVRRWFALASEKNGRQYLLTDGAGTNGRQPKYHLRPKKTYLESPQKHLVNYTFLPVFLLIISPNLVVILWYTAIRHNGSLMEFLRQVLDQGCVEYFVRMWSSVHIFSPLASLILLGYCAWALLLMVLVPGPETKGPVTPKGNVPTYKDNGFTCYCITMVAFFVFTCFLKSFGHSPTIIYDRFDEFICTMTLFSFVFCVFLYVKGRFWPSSSDHGSSGNLIFDFFWGLELHPRVFGIDVKVFTNCRFGMTVWPLLVCIYTLKSYELHGFVDSAWVSAALQTVYFAKFFWWESGYMRTIDIKLDRAGYYICWGCLVYVPGVYASVSMYLVNQPVVLGPFLSLAIFLAGIACCLVNYLADRQKQVVRNTDGNCTIWGRRPEVIRAWYSLEDGDKKENLLLVSGFWGIARHFHYVPELVLAFLWTLPALFDNLLPFVYMVHLFILLIHRTYRDDFVCKAKYKEHWNEYLKIVPYKMIPLVF